MDIPSSFILTIILFSEALNLEMVQTFKVVLSQTLNHYVYNCVILTMS
jgi:hypothetical protein